jgi:surfactin synthase thioesterase subunit
VFHGWGAALPDTVEVDALQLPGRGSRYRDPRVTDMSEMVRAVVDVLEPELAGMYGFFGHSMGARIAFEAAREIHRRGLPEPAQLWVSGSRAPHLPPRRAPIHGLPHDAFIAELRRYGGAPAAVFEDRELMELCVPTLRADFALLDTYEHRASAPLSISTFEPMSFKRGRSTPAQASSSRCFTAAISSCTARKTACKLVSHTIYTCGWRAPHELAVERVPQR